MDYRRKLYAWIQSGPWNDATKEEICNSLQCFRNTEPNTEVLNQLKAWWEEKGKQCCAIATSSDRINIESTVIPSDNNKVCHPISGKYQTITPPNINTLPSYIETIKYNTDPKYVFWWLWRFSPEWDKYNGVSLLHAAHPVLPDCSWHSYQNTVSALAGTISHNNADSNNHPYLFLFSFSPIQDFIKASRKFLDFWAGSYLLHYLSAQLCWEIAKDYGPDALIVPSLWSQEIIDALWLTDKNWSDSGELDETLRKQLKTSFQQISNGDLEYHTPVAKFEARISTSLSTAGFPNMITALVPNQKEAERLGNQLSKKLTDLWLKLGKQVCHHIRDRVSQYAKDTVSDDKKWKELWDEVSLEMPQGSKPEPYKQDLDLWCSQTNSQDRILHPGWRWWKLWESQLNHTWEPYWTAVPLGDPAKPWICPQDEANKVQWQKAQNRMAQPWPGLNLPTKAETNYDKLNVGTWWGSLQQRLRISLQTVKNTRAWQIPAAPGERSTISGQFSAVHPSYNYGVITRDKKQRDLREGGGLPSGKLRFFWLVMAKAYPGLFNGSERLNALEITKRMAWIYGGVAQNLGISIQKFKIAEEDENTPRQKRRNWKIELTERLKYERFLRFPNLSSIAAARITYESPDKVRHYQATLSKKIGRYLAQSHQDDTMAKLPHDARSTFRLVSRVRPSQIPKTDRNVNPHHQNAPLSRNNLNGVMFSSKWLSEDMNVDLASKGVLRQLVDQAHQECGFVAGSPSDWWAVVLADGDGMGNYVSGSKLLKYEQYLNTDILNTSQINDWDTLSQKTKKRMGPATHLGLNRALLDFSNRLVPYLTEQRFCGKLIYSGGDDVMAVLPIEDLPEYILSLQSAWCGQNDPYRKKDSEITFSNQGDYWRPQFSNQDTAREKLPDRPLFTMGKGATLSMGVVIAHKSVPLPSVLETLWEAESDRAKEMPDKNGLCFRVIYSGGNQLEALMNGDLLCRWWYSIYDFPDYGANLAPVLHRLAEELPQRAILTPEHNLVSKAARVIMARREASLDSNFKRIEKWLYRWESWAKKALAQQWPDGWSEPYQEALRSQRHTLPLGTHPDDLGKLLRFTAFWVSERVIRHQWLHPETETETQATTQEAA